MASCTALVLLTLGAVGEGGRRRAREFVCQANLQQWNSVFQDYVQRNDGKFFSGITANGYWWPLQLTSEQQNWRRNRTWFCPTATIPSQDDHGRVTTVSSIYSAWGIYKTGAMTYQGQTYESEPNGLCGSYGLNAYLLDIPKTGPYYVGSVPAQWYWRGLTNVPNADGVPMFIDALRFDLWPQDTDPPAASEMSSGWSSNVTHMAKCCLNRHDGAVNCLFVDGSVRKVGLKELWTLKWHKSFNTAGPWTLAGGVLPEDWPQWLAPFKDY
jgi:prepilin-type processing-associated H-X9-DG protein